jgi:hypothetical protein
LKLRTRLVAHLIVVGFVLARSTMLSAQDAAPGKVDKDTFTATLSDGLQIQVIGLNEHPLEGQWWKPDGSPLSEAPYDKMEGGVDGPNLKIRHIAIRIDHHPEVNDTISITLTPSPSGTSSSTPMLGGKQTNGIDARICGFANDPKTVDIKFQIATGAWETKQTSAHGGSSSSGADEGFIFSSPHANGKRTSMVVAFYLKENADDKRLIAVDQGGKEHTCATSFGTSIKDVYFLDSSFDLKPSQIKEYRLQTRPYDTEVQFKDVSLDRDNRTDVAIEIGAPQP